MANAYIAPRTAERTHEEPKSRLLVPKLCPLSALVRRGIDDDSTGAVDETAPPPQ
jgi:hypothetical protein